jgi:hypothetical protein
MTLQPYDGAHYALLPDGRTCWEKETKTYGGSEITCSYQYSVELGDLPTDWNGRVTGLMLLAPDGTWNDIVTLLPVSMNLVARLKATMEQGWALLADHADGRYFMGSEAYLKICEDVLAVLKSGVKK